MVKWGNFLRQVVGYGTSLMIENVNNKKGEKK